MQIIKNYSKKFMVGDLHGHWSVILRHLDTMDGDICYIQVGDFGVGFDPDENSKLLKLNSFLKEKNSDIYIVRGNHDNPYWFIEDFYDDFKSDLTNIHFIKDYSVLNIDGENLLFIGGAISIDRVPRIKRGVNQTTEYWSEEKIVFNYDKANEYRNIDRIFCHTAPNFAMPRSIGKLVYDFAVNDTALITDISNERSNLTKLIDIIMSNNKVKSYSYGHFHHYYRTYISGCEFVCVDIDQFIQF